MNPEDLFLDVIYEFNSGLQVRRSKTLEEAQTCSSGRTKTNLYRLVTKKTTFMTPGAFVDYIKLHCKDGKTPDDIWDNIQESIRRQIENNVNENDINPEYILM